MSDSRRLLLSYYGDDLTGSSDVMESLALNGIPNALFFEVPTLAELEAFRLKKGVGGSRLMAFGVAGIARSLNPVDMETELVPIFEQLSQMPTDFFHYKICSTLDSSPETGNIGLATDLAQRFFPSTHVPLIVGAPFINRFVVFGNLFARLDGRTYRLDQHPVMSCHPVTPMTNSDINEHLALQTDRGFQLFDLHSLELCPEERRRIYDHHKGSSGDYILFDSLTNEQLQIIGGLIYEGRPDATQLLVGSSGVEYGIARYLQEKLIVTKPPECPAPGKAQRLIIIAGSCSPVTARQLAYAIDHGFANLKLDVMHLIEDSDREISRIMEMAVNALNSNQHLAIYTAEGPTDPSISETQSQISHHDAGRLIGETLGRMVKELLTKVTDTRLVVAGGDTSGYVSRQLKLYALETLCPLAPGAPLCVAHAKNPDYDGLQIAFKGGQIGQTDFFETVLNGHA